MPTYCLTLFYRLAGSGWTEKYYREAATARIATDLGGFEGVRPFLRVRAHPTQLQAIRAQEVDGLRRIFLRLVGDSALSSPGEEPDLSPACARLWLPYLGGGGRHLFLRGLPDDHLRRDGDPEARIRPANVLLERIAEMSARIRELDLRGQHITPLPGNPWLHALGLGGWPGVPQWSRLRLRPGIRVEPGQYVYLGGAALCCPLRTKTPYLVAAVDGDALALVAPWPTDLRDLGAEAYLKARVLTYEYPPLLEARVNDLTHRITRGRYRAASWTPDSPWTMPLHPCGRIVDYIRDGSAYSVPMRVWRDDPGATARVTWYFVEEDGRGTIGYEHPFGSRSWELQGYPTLLGESFEGRARASGLPPVELKGIGLGGSREQWMHGALTADPLIPINPRTGAPCACGEGVLVLDAASVTAGGILRHLDLDAASVAAASVAAASGPAKRWYCMEAPAKRWYCMEPPASSGTFPLTCVAACEEAKLEEWVTLGQPVRWYPLNCTMPTARQGDVWNPWLLGSSESFRDTSIGVTEQTNSYSPVAEAATYHVKVTAPAGMIVSVGRRACGQSITFLGEEVDVISAEFTWDTTATEPIAHLGITRLSGTTFADIEFTKIT